MAGLNPIALVRALFGTQNRDRLQRGGFFRNVLVVMFGTGLAQLFTVACSPILSRLFSPESFGIYSSFLSLVAILGAAATLQYCEALLLPREDSVAASLFWASCTAATAIPVLAGLVWILAPNWLGALLQAPELKGWMWLVPWAALVGGYGQTLSFWCARRKAYKASSSASAGRNLLANASQAGGGWMGWGAGALIGGGLLGDLVSNSALFLWVLGKDGALLRNGARARSVWAAAWEHRDFAVFIAGQSVLNAASLGAPVILLIHYYGALTGGLYAFSVRVLQVPLTFVASAVWQVLFQKLSQVHHEGGDVRKLFLQTTSGLLLLCLVPACVGAVFAPRLFAFVFGAKWYVAGEYARWLLVWLVPGFCNMPASLSLRVLRRGWALLLLDLAMLLGRVGVLVWGGPRVPPLHTIAAFSLLGGLVNLVLIVYAWKSLHKRAGVPPSVAL